MLYISLSSVIDKTLVNFLFEKSKLLTIYTHIGVFLNIDYIHKIDEIRSGFHTRTFDRLVRREIVERNDVSYQFQQYSTFSFIEYNHNTCFSYNRSRFFSLLINNCSKFLSNTLKDGYSTSNRHCSAIVHFLLVETNEGGGLAQYL